MRVKRIVSFLLVFALGGLVGALVIRRVDFSSAASAPLTSEEVREMAMRMRWREEQQKSDEADEHLKRLSGNWISADGQKKAKANDDILEFGTTPDWPEIEGRRFLLGKDYWAFVAGSGRYNVMLFQDRPDELVIFRKDDKTESLSRLTLYREGSKHAASLPPLPDTPPPPKIQKLLDLIRGLKEHESVADVDRRMDWQGEAELINGSSSLGEADLEFDLRVDDQWVLQRKENQSGKLLRFRLVRTWVKERRDLSADVERVVYPYYEFGKVITGPSEDDSPSKDPE